MGKIDPDWWKRIFDEVYLVTDARSVCNEALTKREVDFIQGYLGLRRSWPILDLCGGQGRHSLELSRRGFTDITVLDYSQKLIDLGRRRAEREGLEIRFVQGDARHTGLPDGRFRVAILMASSFGYFEDDSQNRKILKEAFRLLAPGGQLLLDLPDRDQVLKCFTPQSTHQASEDVTVERQRRFIEDVIYSREKVFCRKRGLIKDTSYCTRLYTPHKIDALLRRTGFNSVDLQEDFCSRGEKTDYGLLTNRMVVLAGKP